MGVRSEEAEERGAGSLSGFTAAKSLRLKGGGILFPPCLHRSPKAPRFLGPKSFHLRGPRLQFGSELWASANDGVTSTPAQMDRGGPMTSSSTATA
jgi:hypothetical protein